MPHPLPLPHSPSGVFHNTDDFGTPPLLQDEPSTDSSSSSNNNNKLHALSAEIIAAAAAASASTAGYLQSMTGASTAADKDNSSFLIDGFLHSELDKDGHGHGHGLGLGDGLDGGGGGGGYHGQLQPDIGGGLLSSISSLSSHNAGSSSSASPLPELTFAKLTGDNWSYVLQDFNVVLGRTGSSTDSSGSNMTVFHLGSSKTISRRHAMIGYNFSTGRWGLTVFGRNGLKVNELFFLASEEPILLSDGMIIDIGGISFAFSTHRAEELDQQGIVYPSSMLLNRGIDRFNSSSSEAVSTSSSSLHLKHFANNNSGDSSSYSYFSVLGSTSHLPSSSLATTPSSSTANSPSIIHQFIMPPLTASTASTSSLLLDTAAKTTTEGYLPAPPPPAPTTTKTSSSKSNNKGGNSSGKPTKRTPQTQPTDTTGKPPLSNLALVQEAIASSADKRLTVQEIYASIEAKYTYFRSFSSWKSSIRHALSMTKNFMKIPNPQNLSSNKGCSWMAIPDYEKMMAERMANGVIDFLPVTSATTSPNATTTTQPPKGKSNNRKRPASAASNNGGGEKNPKPVKVARTEHHPLPAESLSVTAAAAAGGGGGDGIIAPLPRSAAGYDNWTDPLWVADSESLDSSPAEGTGTKKEIEPPNPGDLNYFIF